MKNIFKMHTIYLCLIVIPICFILQSCAMTGFSAGNINVMGVGVGLGVAGIGLAFAGFKLATRSTLEQWAMKLLKVDVLILLLG